jgi:tetratricopeptide (TPR) repeat protein
MQSPLQTHTDVRPGVGWLLLALGALAISTLCALLLVLARLPWSGTPAGLGDLFGRALVLHVSQAVVVWFLACAAALWTLAAGVPARPARRAALMLCVVGLAAMVLPMFLHDAQPVLANYVPVLDHPVFFAGLALFAAGLALCGTLAFPPLLRRVGHAAPWHLGVLLSIGVAGMALLALLASLAQLREHVLEATTRFELLAWGPGHILQFVHMLLLMSVWTVLGEQVLGGQPVAPRRWLQGLLLLAAAPVLAVPLIYFNNAIDSADFRHTFTWLMAWGIWPAAALLALRLLLQIRRAGHAAWRSPHAVPLVLSIFLFLLGCVLGALIRSDTTLVPAHYHGTVGAVTLAYMALGYQLLQAYTGQPNSDSLQRWQQLGYGCGLLLLALGLAWSGWLGVPRKSTHLQTLLYYPGYFVAMGVAGLGGLLAIAGAGMFVFNVVRSVCRSWAPARLPRQRFDVRVPALALTLALVGVLGGLLAGVSADSQGTRIAPPQVAAAASQDHARQMRLAEVDRRFSSGVVLLSGRNFDLAASEFHRVLELAPKMPEAHVNMGFALLGSRRYAVAKDFFSAAIDLNTGQLNAYYGLALALEGLDDLPGARGAMRSYIHLARADDPYVTRANAALWEWDGALKLAQQSRNSSPSGTLR